MPKKPEENKFEDKNTLVKYAKEFFSFLLPLLEKNTERLQDLVCFVKVRKILKRYVVLAVVLIAALVIFLDGASLFIGSFFPDLRPGTFNMIIGIIIIVLALIYERS